MVTLVSRCLTGEKCNWKGEGKFSRKVEFMMTIKMCEVIFVCPECLGGLNIPREPAEIQGGTGEDVLDGKCRVLTKSGEDVTEKFIRGAEAVLKIAKESGADVFIGRKSPSCGCLETQDGTFSGSLRKGSGVTAALLKRNGIKIIDEKELIIF